MVRLRLEGRRLGGVGGFMKSGEGGAELFLSLGGTTTMGAGVWARKLLSDEAVLIPKLLMFRAFFAGVVGLCNSKKAFGEESPEAASLLDLKSATNEEGAAVLARGDSGDGPGDGSVTEDESMVDMVVVGELSEDVVELLSRLSWCM
jgi:hypothetical protein